jgi:hypothetical protein
MNSMTEWAEHRKKMTRDQHRSTSTREPRSSASQNVKPMVPQNRIKKTFSTEDLNEITTDLRRSPSSLSHFIEN